MLNCERNTPAMQRRIAKAARAHFDRGKVSTVYEHGQWWVLLPNGAQYSVIDAEGPGIAQGFDFEQVTPPDDD